MNLLFFILAVLASFAAGIAIGYDVAATNHVLRKGKKW